MPERPQEVRVPHVCRRPWPTGRRVAALAALPVLALAGCAGGSRDAGGRTTPAPAGPTAPASAPAALPPVPAPAPVTSPPPSPVLGSRTATPARPATTSLPPPAALPPPVPSTGRDLAGRTLVLDAGHNGGNSAQPTRLAALVPAGGYSKACNTAGTQTDSGYPEHAFTFDVVGRAAALLRARGATVVLTRSSDSGFGPCVDERAAVANRARAAAVVSVHADGGPPSGRGFHVIAPALAPDGGNAAVLAPGYALALALRSSFRSATGEPYATYTAQDGLARRSDLAGLTLARVPTVFLECANMRNAADAALVTSADWRARAAAGVAAAAAAFVLAG